MLVLSVILSGLILSSNITSGMGIFLSVGKDVMDSDGRILLDK